MRSIATALLVLSLTFLAVACAPKASGPPSGSEETVSAPAATPQEAGPETAGAPPQAGTEAATTPMTLPSGHPPLPEGVAPPAGHMQGEMARQTEGVVTSLQGDSLILARPSGTELRFSLPEDLKMLPEGKTREDVVQGARIKISIRTTDKGMEAEAIEVLEPAPEAK